MIEAESPRRLVSALAPNPLGRLCLQLSAAPLPALTPPTPQPFLIITTTITITTTLGTTAAQMQATPTTRR